MSKGQIPKKVGAIKGRLRVTHPGLCPAARQQIGRTRGKLENEQAIGSNDNRNCGGGNRGSSFMRR